MKYLILLFGFLMFGACNSQVDPTTQNNLPEQLIKESVGVKPQAPALKKDTMPAITSRKNYYKSTARPVTEINTLYPYDIKLKTAFGEVLNSEDVLKTKGQPIILLFWLTTCGPCAREMQAISQVYEKWQKETDFRLVAISTDFPKNHSAFVKRVEEKQWPWETYLDLNREFSSVMPGRLNGLPQTFVLDADGQIVYHKRKYSAGDEHLLYEKVKAL